MVGLGLVRERRLVVSTEAGAVVRAGLIVTVAVMGGLDILLTQVGHEESDHCKRGDHHYEKCYPPAATLQASQPRRRRA